MDYENNLTDGGNIYDFTYYHPQQNNNEIMNNIMNSMSNMIDNIYNPEDGYNTDIDDAEIDNDEDNDGESGRDQPVFNASYNDPIFNVLSDNYSRDVNYLYNPMLDRGFGIRNNINNRDVMTELTVNMNNINFGIRDITGFSTCFMNPVGMNCSICITDYEPESKSFILLKCSHSFCRDCIEEWFKDHSVCPLCRHNFLNN